MWCSTLVCVALGSVWGMDSRGGLHRFKRWPPSRVWCDSLLRVALSSIQDPLDASTIVGYILVIPDARHALPDTGITVLLTRVTILGHEYRRCRSSGVQEYNITEVQMY